MNNKWTIDEVDYLKDNWYKIDINEAVKYLTRHTRSSILSKINEEKLQKMGWSKQQIEIVKINYGKIHIDELCKLINKSKQAVYTKAYRLGLESRQYINIFSCTLNEDFFNTPNPINSYWAGFIAADGNIGKNLKTFSVSQNDKEVIEEFKRQIEFSGRISIKKRSCKLKNSHYKLTANSCKIVQDLINNFNIIPNKSLTLKPPIKLDYYNSLCYIIGLCDGDGSICWIKNKNPNGSPSLNFIIAGTKEICEWVQTILNIKGYIKKHKIGNVYYYTISHKKARQAIYKLRSIKELENIRFSRKWDKILEYNKLSGISS